MKDFPHLPSAKDPRTLALKWDSVEDEGRDRHDCVGLALRKRRESSFDYDPETGALLTGWKGSR